MREALLDIDGLWAVHRGPEGDAAILEAVSLVVGRGEIVGVVGESGCGKSTLGRAILRLLPEEIALSARRFRLDDIDLLSPSEAALRRLRGLRAALIPQDPMSALNPVLSIGRQMSDILYRSGLDAGARRRRAIEALALVGIPDPARRIDDFPHRFSGGMLQRVLIAMAVLLEPDLLIADEPTTALDTTLRAQIMALLADLHRRTGCAMLFISHDLGLVGEFCQRAVVMYAGRIVEEAPTAALLARPGHPYSKALIACDPARIPARTLPLPTIAGSVPPPGATDAGCSFRARCLHARPACAAPQRWRDWGLGSVLCNLPARRHEEAVHA